MQMICRDRNRIAMQSDMFGAYALGIRNILCLSGDHQKFGNHPTAKNVFDLDSIQLIQRSRRCATSTRFWAGMKSKALPRCSSGRRRTPSPIPLSSGSSGWPRRPRRGWISSRPSASTTWRDSSEFMQMVRDRGLHEKIYILAGVTPLKSVGMARYMKDKVAGMEVPDEIIEPHEGGRQRESPGGGPQDLRGADPAAQGDRGSTAST